MKPQLFFSGLLLLLLLISCDFSTHEYISYKDENSSTFFSWYDETSKEADFYTEDSTLIFNNLEVYFFSDNSTLKAKTVPGYKYLGDSDNDGREDSVKTTFYQFPIAQTDARITENDSVRLIFRIGKMTVRKMILQKSVSESNFLDRIPLPRMH